MRALACRSLLRMLLIIVVAAGVVEQCASFPAAVPRLLPSVVVVATRRHSLYRLRVSSEQQQHQQETTPTETTTESIARNNVLQWTTLQQQDTTVEVEVEVVTLVEHRPMGCIVEESLATTVTGTVFVASVKQGGNAALAGVLPGDVIVGITGLFGELEDVSGMGIDKVKALVASRPDSEALQLRLVRGTAVMADHEAALTELCANPDNSDDEAEQCMLDFLQGAYYNDEDDDTAAPQNSNCDPDNECVLDDMHTMWAEDLPTPPPPQQPNQSATADTRASSSTTTTTTKPWSSRASPSGTFVRDPVTGEMRNIDS